MGGGVQWVIETALAGEPEQLLHVWKNRSVVNWMNCTRYMYILAPDHPETDEVGSAPYIKSLKSSNCVSYSSISVSVHLDEVFSVGAEDRVEDEVVKVAMLLGTMVVVIDEVFNVVVGADIPHSLGRRMAYSTYILIVEAMLSYLLICALLRI